jgi:Fic family protein
VKDPRGFLAFVPTPLEPQLRLEPALVSRIAEANGALGELSGMARMLPNPGLLTGSFLRQEAVYSSRIEGTRASLTDLLFFEADTTRELAGTDVKEVGNFVLALEHGLARSKDLPVSLRLLREIHAKLMRGVRGESQAPGEFRRTQNWIGRPGCTLTDAVYVPPPVEEMHRCLDSLEKYLHRASDLPYLVRLAFVHYQFEAIHPFLDGNGRIGRLLISLLLVSEGLLPQPYLALSSYLESNRDEYYRLLLNVSREAAWEEWIAFFLEGVRVQSRDAAATAERLLSMREAWRARLLEQRAAGMALALVDELFTRPSITNGWIVKRLRITPRAAQANIDKLAAMGFLKEITGKQRGRVYLALDIIKAIEGGRGE